MNKLQNIWHKPIFYYGVFFGWNVLLFFTLLTVEINVQLFSKLIHNVFIGYTPASYLINTVIVFLIPLVSCILALIYFRKKPVLLLRWFYGFEIPLLFMALFRIFGFKELTPPIALWFAFWFISVLGYGLRLLYSKQMPLYIKQFLTTFSLVAGILLSVFLIIYILPLTAIFIKSIPDWTFHDLWGETVFVFLSFFFFILSCTLFFISPIAIIIYYIRDGIRELKSSHKRNSIILPVAVALVVIIFLLYPRSQPQLEAFALVKEWKEGRISNSEAIASKDDIREGLLNAYLYRQRYIGIRGNQLLKDLYEEAFDSLPGIVANINYLYEAPFIFKGDYGDKQRAALDYETFFDIPMERAEGEAIIAALSANNMPQTVEAGIIDIGGKQVEVTDRNIEYEEREGGVEVRFHERYINHTYQQQEVFYYFSLPPQTVITGLWLSDEDGNPQKYTYVVAPRGAAQQTYREIRGVRRDPALLEQVGPYQYRLRIFPIPAREYIRFNASEEDRESIKERPMHLSLRLLTVADEEGHIKLPQLTEKRNVYWPAEKFYGSNEEEWFPPYLEKFTPSSQAPETAYLDGVVIEKRDISSLKRKGINSRIALCIDGSYSMNEHAESLSEIWENFPYKSQSTLYIAETDGLRKVDNGEETLFAFAGANDPYRALSELRNKLPDHHLVWITDQGSYELLMQDSARKPFASSSPIDIVHISQYAPIYEDALIESVLQSGGGVYKGMNEWLRWQQVDIDKAQLYWRDGHKLYTFKEDSLQQSSSKVLEPLLASRYAMALSREMGENSLEELDAVHKLATKYSFVSPFSSMICLVDDAQRKMLEEAASKDDRFEREVETGNNSGGTLNAIGVPEPHEWVMLIFAFGLMLYLYRESIREFIGSRLR